MQRKAHREQWTRASLTSTVKLMRALLAGLSLSLLGCGATSLRVALAPTLDDSGRGGFEAYLMAGLGMPLDYSGRSHHFVQSLVSLGGGADPRTKHGLVLMNMDLSYLYRGDRVMDIRVGPRFSMRALPTRDEPWMLGMGFSVGIMPILVESGSEWITLHWNLGAELRIDHFWSDLSQAEHSLFSPALVFDINLLATGD